MNVRNRPYDQPAQHTFSLETNDYDQPFPARITLSEMTGLPLPWQTAEGALRFMLQHEEPQHLSRSASHEDLTTVDPDTADEGDIILILKFRSRPDGSTLGSNGVRTYRGTIEARITIPTELRLIHDPLNQPLTRIRTEIAVTTGQKAVLVDVIESPGAHRYAAEGFCQRAAESYGLSKPSDGDSRALELGIADLQWDLEGGLFQHPSMTTHRAAMLNYTRQARWELEHRASKVA